MPIQGVGSRHAIALHMLALWCAVLTMPRAQAEFETPLAITGVRIVGDPQSSVEPGTIVIDDGLILDAGAEVDVPIDALHFDGTGLIAYPGFIDGQTHLGIPERPRTEEQRRRVEDFNPDPSQGALAATRFANRRGIRPELRVVDHYAPEQKQLEAHRAAGFTAGLIAPRDAILGGTSDLLNLSDAPIRRCVLARNVAVHASFIVGEEGRYPRSLLGVFAQFRQVMLDAQWHAKVWKYTQRHPATTPRAPTDAAIEALQALLAREQPIIFEANTENEIRRALDLTGEFNLRVVISGAKEAWKVMDRLQAERISLIVSLKFDKEPDDAKSVAKRPKPGPPEGKKQEAQAEAEPDEQRTQTIYEPLKVRRERRRLWEEQVDNVIRLHEAGVSFALRTRDCEKPSQFWKNLRRVIARGLPEHAAVRALTLAPAKLLGMDQRLGAIDRGYIANLTLMDRRLSDEKGEVRFVFIDGKRFDVGDKEDETQTPASGDELTTRNDMSQPADARETKPSVEPKVEEAGPRFAAELKADRIPATRTGGNVLIRNATIMPVSSPPMRGASLLIQEGRISAVGHVPTVPQGVTVVDATGRFVIPGFVDCHSHLGTDGTNESSVAISAEVRIADVINPHHVGIYRAVAGGTTVHHVMHGSANPIGGQNAVLKLKYGRPAAEMLLADVPGTIKFALGENVTQANWQRAWGKRFPNTRMGVEAVMRTAFTAANAYRREWGGFARSLRDGLDTRPPRRDLRLEALADVLAGRLTVHAHCYRSDEILRLLAVAEDYGFRIGTLQHVLEGYRIAPEIARHGCGASTFSNFWAYKIEAYGAIPFNAALMTQKGVNVSVNSDSPNTVRYLGQEAAKCIKWGGLSENEALRLVTLNPAMQLQIDHRVGSLEIGKDGDAAVFNGHPLNTFSKCVMTLIDGEVFFEDHRPEPTEPCADLPLPGTIDRIVPPTPHRAYAVVGATIHPISGPVIENGTVVILDDRIHDVETDASVPPGAGVIPGRGLHVYPGLIDAGSTLGLVEIRMIRGTRDNRDIATLAPHVRAESAVHPHSEHVRITRTAGVTSALTEPSGDRIAGQSAIIHLDGWTVPEMLVVPDAALHMSVPSLPIHLPEDKKEKKKRTKEHKKAIRDLEDFLDRARHYAKLKDLAARDPNVKFERDVALEAMIPYVRGEKPVVFSAHEYKHILDTIEFAEKQKLRCILTGATASWKLADTLADKNIPVILTTPLGYPRGEFEPWDSVYRCAAVLHNAGVRFCFGSGTAAGAYNLPIQAGMAVAHGLPRERAEHALTLGAAEILGVADRVGSIEAGKLADLIVTTDTPLQTVGQVTHMFIAGDPIDLTSLHTETYEKFKDRPDPRLPPLPELVGPPNLTRAR